MRFVAAERLIAAAESKFCDDASELLTNALQTREVQRRVDAETGQSTRTPPRPILRIYEEALDAATTRFCRGARGATVNWTVNYKMKGRSWNATVVVTATFRRDRKGGKTYQVKPDETIWQIAERHYGSGFYWPAIESENPFMVSDGNFILAGIGLSLPSIDTLADLDLVPAIKTASAPANARRPARTVRFPTLEMFFSGSRNITTTTIRARGVTAVLSVALKGKIKVRKDGSLPAGFAYSRHEREATIATEAFATAIKCDKLGVKELSFTSEIARTGWKAKFVVGKDGTFTVNITPKMVDFHYQGFHMIGELGIDASCRITVDPENESRPPSAGAAQSLTMADRIEIWFQENGTLVAGVAVTTAAAIVAATLIEDVVSGGAGVADDAVSFRLAYSVARAGLRYIR
ncbi:LysM domain-containing protein [Pseudorhodobacter sp. E13]|uniref:LysM peptidoglycan-binding domain-containing protein n=1 Tax=Pseudorhodobacter sp. E13 TaxID=2487931 RepID=UPI000F8F7C15|nr:LysM domain-containing protein [Pseudorhodobacter sp. E13]RUS58536.1 LysM domain-containing protein [Pseudorhodobacter sp. E13]